MLGKTDEKNNSVKRTKQKVERKMNDKIKMIIIGIVVGIIGYLVYAYVMSNVIDACIPANGFCNGIFPFERQVETDLPGGSGGGIKKPIIYLYPEEETSTVVRLGNPDLITTSYPQYIDGWRVLARPDGTLTDLNTGRELYSLYWEGENGDFEMTREGFVVEGNKISDFLEKKLDLLGLNSREAEEFIIYWLPKLQQNKYNYVRFASVSEINNYMPLEVNPQPDTIIRILMLYKPLENMIDVDEQILGPAPERKGFTLVEWGGSQLK